MKNGSVKVVVGLGLALVVILAYDHFVNPSPTSLPASSPSKTIFTKDDPSKVDRPAQEKRFSSATSSVDTLSRKISSGVPVGKELSKEMVSALLRDPSLFQEQVVFQQGSERFTSLPGVVAVSREDLTEAESKMALGTFLGLSVIPKDNLESADKGYPIVVEKERGTLALVTGNLQIEHSDSVSSKGLEETFGLKLLQSFPAIHLSLFSTNSLTVRNLLQLANSIRNNPGVERVTLELVDRVRSTN